jgi:predicted dinucleotide-utilizing enzyme
MYLSQVAHPNVTKAWGTKFLNNCDYMSASTTAFADQAVMNEVLGAAYNPAVPYGLYVTSGALWGVQDIQKMSDSGKLAKLIVSMKKHPDSLYPKEGTEQHRLNEEAKSSRSQEEVVVSLSSFETTTMWIHPSFPFAQVLLFDGPVRELCMICPVNVNTMATAAIAAAKSCGAISCKPLPEI